MKTTILSMRLMNSGVNFRLAASTAERVNLHARARFRIAIGRRLLQDRAVETQLRRQDRTHLRRAQVACHEDHRAREIHAAVVPKGSVSLYPGCPAASSTTSRSPFRSHRTERSLPSTCPSDIDSALPWLNSGMRFTVTPGIREGIQSAWRFRGYVEIPRNRS